MPQFALYTLIFFPAPHFQPLKPTIPPESYLQGIRPCGFCVYRIRGRIFSVMDRELCRSDIVLKCTDIDSRKSTYDITYVWRYAMTNITATEARKRLYKLLDEVSQSHEPIQIAGKRNSAVLVGEDDWRAIQETLYLTSIPGMRESIKEGMNTPVEECEEELDW